MPAIEVETAEAIVRRGGAPASKSVFRALRTVPALEKSFTVGIYSVITRV